MTDHPRVLRDEDIHRMLTATFAGLPRPSVGARFERGLSARLADRDRVRSLRGAPRVAMIGYWCLLAAVVLAPVLRVLAPVRDALAGPFGLGLWLALVPITLLATLVPDVAADALRRLVRPLVVGEAS